MPTETDLIKARIAACADQAQTNAATCGGDDSMAASDLLCAFILICQQNDADPDAALASFMPHGKSAVADLFPKYTVN